jgi:hypothetical protein
MLGPWDERRNLTMSGESNPGFYTLMMPGGRLDWPREIISSRHPAEENGAAAAGHRQVRELIAMIGVAGENRRRPLILFGGHDPRQLMRPSHRPKRERERSGCLKSGFQTVRAADDERGAGNALVTRGQARWPDSGLSSACRFRRGQSGASKPRIALASSLLRS